MEKEKRRAYRICPCNPWDVEGIQSWLEDLSEEGLFLAEDGVFCGVFTFERGKPRRLTYRLDVAQKQKPRLWDSGGLSGEEMELYRAMGWEYLLQYGAFRIYRAVDREAPELNTESQTHAVTIGYLKRNQRSALINVILLTLFWLLHTGSALRYTCLNLVNVGVIFTLCVYSGLLLGTGKAIARVVRLRRFEKRLLAGDSLNRYKNWRKGAGWNCCVRLLPLLLCCGIGFGFGSALIRTGDGFPLEEYPDPPFATLKDVFPVGSVVERSDWLDYGTAKRWNTAVAKNAEWNENGDITTPEGQEYYGILLLNYHETAAEWIARGLEEDYYVQDASNYRGKRFAKLEAPELGVDSVRVYTSYGTLYVLMREGNRVAHAVVHLNNGSDQNQWILWAEAMARKLTAA